jgi:hypothetical protein
MRAMITICIAAIMGLFGCDPCYNVACDAPNLSYINGLQFAFDTASFPLEEVNNAFILRFTLGNIAAPVDTIFLKNVITEDNRTFTIPLAVSGSTGEVESIYGIYANNPEYASIVTNINTKGYYPTDCCCCYRNTTKTYTLNGTTQDRTGVLDAVILEK